MNNVGLTNLQASTLVLCAMLSGCVLDRLHPNGNDPDANPVDLRVCSTLDYGHSQAADAFYLRFASDEDAAAFVQRRLDDASLAELSGKDAKLIGISHDDRLLGLVAEVVEGFERVFPEAMQGLGELPKVALLQSDIKNAYALASSYDVGPAGPKIVNPWLFVVHSSLLELKATDSELRGLFAHELGHLILRNGLPEVRAKLQRFYMLGASEHRVIGAVQNTDPEVAAHVTNILKIQERTNGIPELGYPALHGGKYSMLLSRMAASNPSCNGLPDKIHALGERQKQFLPHIDVQELTPRALSDAEQTELTQATEEIYGALRACDDKTVAPMSAVIATLNQLPPEAADPAHPQHAALEALMLEQERQIDADDPDATLVERLIKALDSLRQALLEQRADPAFPIEKLRVYDNEEDADDAASRVLRAIGDDPSGLASFLAGFLPAADAKRCRDEIAAGKGVSYGDLRDAHPLICWRLFHIGEFASALEACSE